MEIARINRNISTTLNDKPATQQMLFLAMFVWFSFKIFHLDLKIVWLWLHFIIRNDIWICFWSKLIYACKTFEMFSPFNLKCWSNELCMRRRRDNQIKCHCKWSNKLLSGKKIIKHIQKWHFLSKLRSLSPKSEVV